MPEGGLLLATALWGGGLVAGLSWVLATRGEWMIACLLLGLAYVSLSLRLEAGAAAPWLAGLRWGLFLAVLFAFWRFRWHPERASGNASDAPRGPGEGPEEE